MMEGFAIKHEDIHSLTGVRSIIYKQDERKCIRHNTDEL